jgi:hypothetical protein
VSNTGQQAVASASRIKHRLIHNHGKRSPQRSGHATFPSSTHIERVGKFGQYVTERRTTAKTVTYCYLQEGNEKLRKFGTQRYQEENNIMKQRITISIQGINLDSLRIIILIQIGIDSNSIRFIERAILDMRK